MLLLARRFTLVIIAPTLVLLWLNGQREGFGGLYYLLPDLVACAVLLFAAWSGQRHLVLMAYALAAGVFMTATLGVYWTEGLAHVPPGAALGLLACAVWIALISMTTKRRIGAGDKTS